jgi:hypothetical protein
MTGPDANTQDTRPAVTTHPFLGVAGVLLGALIATCTGRLMSVGLADIRGAFHLGVDERSWINAAFNASMMGSTFMGHFIAVREEFHSNIIGLNVQLGNGLTDLRFLGLQHAFASQSTGLTAMDRAAQVLALQVRQQAYTLAISDSFLLLATCCAACLAVVSFMSKVPTQYRQVTAAPVEAK